jgi:hypothetical protein
LFYSGAISPPGNGRFPNSSFVFGASPLGMLLLAIGVALDGGALAEAAEVPALMAAWAVAVVLIDRWVVRRR